MAKDGLTGGCLCGAGRLKTKGAPYRIGICHCLDGRKRHGATVDTFAVFPADAVAIAGKVAAYSNRISARFAASRCSTAEVTRSNSMSDVRMRRAK
jgi:hypothetical protein